MGKGPAWTRPEDDFIIEHYGEGAKIIEIAEQLRQARLSPNKRSVSSVISRVRRLGLPSRWKRKAQESEFLSSLPSCFKKSPSSKPREKPLPQSRSCQWPFGDPRRDDFYFCGAKTVSGYSYCDSHCAIAYQQWPPVGLSYRSRGKD